VGEIVDKGRSVQDYKIGERVSAEGHIWCGTCRACRAGKHHLCPNTIGIGVNRDGCFAEYVAVPAQNAWHVHEAIQDDIAAIFDPFGNATHTALSFDMTGEDVLITGAGPIGCHGRCYSAPCWSQKRSGDRCKSMAARAGKKTRRNARCKCR